MQSPRPLWQRGSLVSGRVVFLGACTGIWCRSSLSGPKRHRSCRGTGHLLLLVLVLGAASSASVHVRVPTRNVAVVSRRASDLVPFGSGRARGFSDSTTGHLEPVDEG